jgi:hypothetical protein
MMRRHCRAALAAAGLVVGTIGGLGATLPARADSAPAGGGFDVLGSVMDTTRREISVRGAVEGSKDEARKFRDKLVAGYWEFMQAKSDAKPGEYCAAVFFRADREPQPGGEDTFKNGMTVTMFGPGGEYRGALLAFSPLEAKHAFPAGKPGQKILVTLKQGNDPPATLNALYLTIGAKAQPMIAFAVPTIDALLGGVEDRLSFELTQNGTKIASIAWHSGFAARDAMKRCLAAGK